MIVGALTAMARRAASLGAIPTTLAVLLANPCGADVLKGYTALRTGDYPTAISELKAAALEGDPNALNALGYAYEEFARATVKKRGDCKSIVEAGINDLLPFGHEGKVEAEYALGNLHEFQLKELEAVKWFRRAADREHAMAQWQLGSKYLVGRIGSEGVEQDFTRREGGSRRPRTIASLLGWKRSAGFTQTGKASRRTTRSRSSGSSKR
jgi:TPR repeat protein